MCTKAPNLGPGVLKSFALAAALSSEAPPLAPKSLTGGDCRSVEENRMAFWCHYCNTAQITGELPPSHLLFVEREKIVLILQQLWGGLNAL